MLNANEAYNCGRCGLCLTTCPVYRQEFDETVSPRSKVQLARLVAEGRLAQSPQLMEVFSMCINCGNCTAACPAGVLHGPLFMRLRSLLGDQFGHSWTMRLLFHLLTHEQQLLLSARIARFGRNVIFEKLAADLMIGTIKLKNTPHMNREPFRAQMPPVINPEGAVKGTIVYFVGCATNLTFGSIGWAVVQVLTTMGFRVVVPKDQVCCALPLIMHGALEKARENILTNIRVLGDPDSTAIIVDCATCGSALRKEYKQALGELGHATRAAESLARKVFDISEFVYQHFDLIAPYLINTPEQPETVTYHSPCHLRNAQGIKGIVEQMLSRLPGVKYVPSKDSESCCGAGGSFCLEHPDITKAIAGEKIRNAKATGASFWATGCPGCNLNLSANLEAADEIRVVHPIQVVARLLRKDQ
ncbi:MAG: (Fe-S)-binding protein [Deltaproteobacteria bacterium]|nr:(Fe-S)-binding protein [Deltaproteobacteria bacterium]